MTGEARSAQDEQTAGGFLRVCTAVRTDDHPVRLMQWDENRIVTRADGMSEVGKDVTPLVEPINDMVSRRTGDA